MPAVQDEIRELGLRLIELAGPGEDANLAKATEMIAEARDHARHYRIATAEIRRRQARRTVLPGEFFGEAAWDILLDLVAMQYRGKKVSVTSACAAANLAPTTALRYLCALEDGGYLVRTPDPADARRQWIELTPFGDGQIRATLDAIDSTRPPISWGPGA